MTNLWNFIQFQVGWFALVLGVADGNPALGLFVLACLLVIHFWQCKEPLSEAGLLAAIGFVGWCWESLLLANGLLAYNAYTGTVAPLWMAALWVNFATTLNFSLGWLKSKLFLAALLGMLGGPLAFLAGEALGAVDIVKGWISLAVLAIGWLLLTPLVLLWAKTWSVWWSPVVRWVPQRQGCTHDE